MPASRPAPEVVLVGDNGGSAVLHDAGDGQWRVAGSLPLHLAGCPLLKQALREGKARAAPVAWGDLVIAGQRIPVREPPDLQLDCGPAAGARAGDKRGRAPHPVPTQPDATP